jgi:hypothetical protein
MDASIPTARAAAGNDCPDGPFETDIARIAQASLRETPPAGSRQASNMAVPVEISRILEGGIAFFQGGLMNEGTTTWYAFDIERRLFVAVLCSARTPKRVPAVAKLTSHQLLRYTDAAGYRRAEYVTVKEAGPIQVREFSCLANKLLATPSEKSPRPTPEDAMTKSFSLRHEGKALDLGEGRKRWEIEGELENFITRPLQELILQAL